MTSASLENIKNIFWGETDFPKQAYQQPMEKTQGAVGSKKCGWPITRSQKAWKFPMGRMMANSNLSPFSYFQGEIERKDKYEEDLQSKIQKKTEGLFKRQQELQQLYAKMNAMAAK